MSEKKTVLLVDEDDLSIELHKSFLRTASLNLLTANDGSAALSLVRAAPPDLVFLGLNIKGVDGIECCRRIKQERSGTRRIPVVMLAPAPDSEAIGEMVKAGCDDILYKPISRQKICETTRDYLGTHLWTEPRRTAQAEIEVVFNDGSRKGARVFDFSSGGFFLESETLAPLGSHLILELPQRGTMSAPLSYAATVAWHNTLPNPRKPTYPIGMGVEFIRPVDRDRLNLDGFILSLAEE